MTSHVHQYPLPHNNSANRSQIGSLAWADSSSSIPARQHPCNPLLRTRPFGDSQRKRPNASPPTPTRNGIRPPHLHRRRPRHCRHNRGHPPGPTPKRTGAASGPQDRACRFVGPSRRAVEWRHRRWGRCLVERKGVHLFPAIIPPRMEMLTPCSCMSTSVPLDCSKVHTLLPGTFFLHPPS